MSETNKSHVLVVDDDRGILTLVSRSLEREGYSIATASDSTQAMSEFERRRPDAVVTDVMMPGPSGLAFAAILRSNDDTAGVPIVVMTASHDAYAEWATGQLGKTAFLHKPFTAEQVLEALREVLAK